MIQQTEFTLSAKPRGFHLVTREILSNLTELPKTGLLNLFVQHTSCALSINENADPDLIAQCIESKQRHNSVSVNIVQYHKSPLLIETHDISTEAMKKLRNEYNKNKKQNDI